MPASRFSTRRAHSQSSEFSWAHFQIRKTISVYIKGAVRFGWQITRTLISDRLLVSGKSFHIQMLKCLIRLKELNDGKRARITELHRQIDEEMRKEEEEM